jgi:hypothetical protein
MRTLAHHKRFKLIIGNPQQFAIWFDEVTHWSTYRFSNGCLAYIVDETIYPFNPFLSTIGDDIASMSRFACLQREIGTGNLGGKNLQESFRQLYSLAFPLTESDAQSSDYTHLVSPQSLVDAGYIFFLLQEPENDRLLFAMQDHQEAVREFNLPKGSFIFTLKQAITAWGQFSQSKQMNPASVKSP